MSDNIASSVIAGSRLSPATISSYSASVRPSSRWVAGAAWGAIGAELTPASDERAVGDVSADGLEDRQPAGRARQRVHRVLGMRHEPEDVALLVADAGDVVERSVGILAGGVAQQHLLGVQDPRQLLVGRVVATGGVLDGDRQPLAGLAATREGGV